MRATIHTNGIILPEAQRATVSILLKDRSKITRRRGGGVQNGKVACEVILLRKGWAEMVSAMLKEGHKKFRVSFHVVA